MRGIGLVLAIGLITTSAFGLPLAGDPAAITSGSVVFAEASNWIAQVDYAVYEAGAYPGTHPDAQTNYIYAYQIFNDPLSADTLSTFTLGLLSGSDAASPTSDAGYGAAGGVSPLLSRLVGSPSPTSVQWVLDLSWDQHTTTLLFSSPHSFTFAPATLANGGLGDTHPLPTPVPEPTSMGLLLAGIAMVTRRKRSQ